MEFKEKPTAPSASPIDVRSGLSLQKAELLIKIGCSAEERAVPQKVHLDLDIQFHEPPPGTQTDLLKDTFCYHQLIEGIRGELKDSSFALMEKLSNEIYSYCRRQLHPNDLVFVKVTKVHPPVEGLEGGASFSFGDRF